MLPRLSHYERAMMKIRQAGCLVAATAALLLTVCAGNNTSSSEESSTETSVSAATAVDPQAIQKVNQLFATSTTIENAKQAALKQCMQGKGFTYTPSNVQPAQYDVRSLFQPAELTLEQARANGYKSATSLRTEQNAGNLSPEEQEAFSGSVESQGITADGVPGEVKKDSCVADAYKKLYGSAESGVLFEGGVQNLPLPYVNTAKSDAAMDDVDKKWSQCMQDEHQLSFPNPDNTNISE